MLTQYLVLAVLCVVGVLIAEVEGSQKKGVGFHSEVSTCHDFAALYNIDWWYDWGVAPFYASSNRNENCTQMDKFDRKHVPMVGSWYNDDGSLPVTDYARTQAILGYNEPNNQSGVTPEEAALHWPKLEQHAVGIPLVSPSVSPCDFPKCYDNNVEWFDRFFKACNSCRVDYLATHVYSCSANDMMHFLNYLYSRYNSKIWLTFACRSNSTITQLQFVKVVLPRLEGADYVYRYAWNAARYDPSYIPSAANLLEKNSSQPTLLGLFYMDTNF